MFGRETVTRSSHASPHQQERRAPEPPAELALALQRAAGNHATGRVLARYTAANKDHYEKAAKLTGDVRELIAAVADAHKGTFENKDPRGPLLAPLQQWLPRFEATVKQWEAATDATAEAPAMKQAGEQMKEFQGLRKTLFTELGKGDAAKAEESVKNVLKARQTARADEEARRKRQAEAAVKKAADDKKRGELAAAFPMRAEGAAYGIPGWAKIDAFREHVALSHPGFRGLSAEHFLKATCPLYLLTAAQLKRVDDFAGASTLSEWKEQRVPGSRKDALPFEWWIVPTKADLLTMELGGEIFADWAVENRNHGFRVSKLMEIWSFVSSGSRFVKVTESTNEDGKTKKVYENQLHGKTETKVVTVSGDKVLITCFDTGRR